MIRPKDAADAAQGKALSDVDRLEQREISGHALQPGPAERPRPNHQAGADLIPRSSTSWC